MEPVTRGLLAGAAGTVALDLTSYTDMLLRGRPSSDMPAQVADRLADRVGVGFGDRHHGPNREQAAGALLGYLIGLGIGAAYGVLRSRGTSLPRWIAGPLLGGAAMSSSDLPAAMLNVTAPSSWSLTSWLSDIAPHLAYGLTTAAVFDALGRPRPRIGSPAVRPGLMHDLASAGRIRRRGRTVPPGWTRGRLHPARTRRR